MSRAAYRIEHETRYVHTSGVSTSQHVAYLTPRQLPHQRVRHHEILIEPSPASCVQRVDYFGNAVSQFTILTPYDELSVVGRSVVDVCAAEPSSPGESAPWEVVREALLSTRGGSFQSASEFSYASPYAAVTPELAAFAREAFTPKRPLVDAAIDLMHRIHEQFTFDPGSTTIATPVTKVLADRHGVCQDFAHLQIGCLRSLGLAARYVSGYLLTEPPAGQPRLVGADASHAWLSVWCPRLGWIDLDPTNGCLPAQGHVTVAWGRDYGDVCPLRGVVLGGSEHTMRVAVSMTPVEEEAVQPPAASAGQPAE